MDFLDYYTAPVEKVEKKCKHKLSAEIIKVKSDGRYCYPIKWIYRDTKRCTLCKGLFFV